MTAAWKALDTSRASQLDNARRQLHHAAQLAAAFGISYVQKKSDDSHTNLQWIESAGAFASNAAHNTRVMLRVIDLTLLVDDKSFGLIGHTMHDGAEWIRNQLESKGLDGSRFTLKRHYEIPTHRAGSGEEFDANAQDLEQLARWYANASSQLENVRAAHANASEVRCWPHHFDIATMLAFDGGRSVGAGLQPGDLYYDEPYFYVNMVPAPVNSTLPPALGGKGRWHTSEWIGAVLPAYRLSADPAAQGEQVRSFLKTAIDISARLIGAT